LALRNTFSWHTFYAMSRDKGMGDRTIQITVSLTRTGCPTKGEWPWNLWSLPFLQHRFWRQVGLLESIRRLNGILFPRLDEFRAW